MGMLNDAELVRQLIHPNIVKLKEVIRENDELHMVFEMMEARSCLADALKRRVLAGEPLRVHEVQGAVLARIQDPKHNVSDHAGREPEEPPECT